MSTIDAAVARVRSYREVPNGAAKFVYETFGVTPDPWQEQALAAFCDPSKQRLSLQAAAGVGKSAVMSWCAWYFLATQCLAIGEHPKGIVTGITDANLRDNFWSEMAKWKGRSEWLNAAFTWSAQRIFANDHPETWFLGRRNWPKAGSADEQGATLSGLHGRAVAAFIDESGAIPPTVLRAGEQALADKPWFGKIMQAGNPISLDGMLFAAANKLREQWTIVIVTNDPDDPMRSPRGDIDWARKQIQMYGRDNPWVQSYLLGKFPQASLNSLIGHEDVLAAMNRHLAPDEYSWAQKRLGIDVARFGDDRSVIAPRQGLAIFKPKILRNARTTDLAAAAFIAKQRFGSELEFVDESGFLGAGVVDNLLAAGVPAMAVQFAGKANDPRYANRRAEMWLSMTDAIKRGAALPNEDALVEELTAPTYTFVNGRFLLEDKDMIKKRIGRSPDIADAIALTYALPDMPAAMQQFGQQHRVRTDFDPYGESAQAGGRALTEFDPYARAA